MAGDRKKVLGLTPDTHWVSWGAYRVECSARPTPITFVHLNHLDLTMTTLKQEYAAYKVWAENAPVGKISPLVQGVQFVKVSDEEGNIEEKRVLYSDGHPCHAVGGTVVYFDPRAGYDEWSWSRYRDLPNPVFPRYERFNLARRRGREKYQQWLRSVLSESASAWENGSLEGVRFEEYFEPYLEYGFLYNDTSFEQAIVPVGEEAVSIFETVRDEVVEENRRTVELETTEDQPSRSGAEDSTHEAADV